MILFVISLKVNNSDTKFKIKFEVLLTLYLIRKPYNPVAFKLFHSYAQSLLLNEAF